MTFGLRCCQPVCRPHPASLPVCVPTVESLPAASFSFRLLARPCGSATVAVIGSGWLLSSNETLPMLGTLAQASACGCFNGAAIAGSRNPSVITEQELQHPNGRVLVFRRVRLACPFRTTVCTGLAQEMNSDRSVSKGSAGLSKRPSRTSQPSFTTRPASRIGTPPEPVFTTPRNPHSQFPGTPIHMGRIPHDRRRNGLRTPVILHLEPRS